MSQVLAQDSAADILSVQAPTLPWAGPQRRGKEAQLEEKAPPSFPWSLRSALLSHFLMKTNTAVA